MLDPQFEQDLKNAGVTIEQFRKMTMRQRLDLNLPKRDWRKGWLGDTHVPSHPGNAGYYCRLFTGTSLRSRQKKDKKVTIARAKREKAAQDPVIQAGAAPRSNQDWAGRVVDLAAVEIRDRQHRSIADWIEEFIEVPKGTVSASPSSTTAATITRKLQITGKLREAPSLDIASDIGSPGNIVHDGRAIF